MHPTADFLNLYLSVEKFLYENLATDMILVNKDDVLSRLTEISDAGKAILWHMPTGITGNHCSYSLQVGGTFIKDPGNIGLITLIAKIKGLLETSGSFPMYQYVADAATTEVTQIALIGPVKLLPLVSEPNMFKTRFITINLKFGQILG